MSDAPGPRAKGLSARLKLTLSYSGFLLVAGILLLAVVWLFLLRSVPDGQIDTLAGYVPNRSDLWRAFSPPAAAALVGLLVLGLVGGWFLAGRMLAPLSRMTDASRRAAAGDLAHRIHLDGRSDEFRELADAFDSMLDQIEAHVAEQQRLAEEQQRFAANASHELRTPLAITRTLLDVARDDPTRNSAADFARLQAVNDRAIDLTEALLQLSRVHSHAIEQWPVDLSLEAEEAAETLLPLADARGIVLDVSGDVCVASGSEALLLQMATNLIHNAIVHNVSAGGYVWVRTSCEGGTAVFTVENTGPVLTPAVIDTLTEPFQRGSERARTADHAGVGLGLAIVARIVDAHRGTLALTPRDEGGLRVVVRLPLV